MPFSVYILQSDVDDSLYIGQTSNLEERLLRHNQGRSIYTKSKKPWKVLYSESFDTRAPAVRREAELNSFRRRDLLLKMITTSR